MAIGILDIEAHLQEKGLPADKQAELLFFRNAALRLIALHPDLKPEFLPLNVDTDPLMRFAVLELIRDMNQTQATGGGQVYGQPGEGDAVAMWTAGRPTLPPYVEGLLTPYLHRSSSDGPVGIFPPALAWPAW